MPADAKPFYNEDIQYLTKGTEDIVSAIAQSLEEAVASAGPFQTTLQKMEKLVVTTASVMSGFQNLDIWKNIFENLDNEGQTQGAVAFETFTSEALDAAEKMLSTRLMQDVFTPENLEASAFSELNALSALPNAEYPSEESRKTTFNCFLEGAVAFIHRLNPFPAAIHPIALLQTEDGTAVGHWGKGPLGSLLLEHLESLKQGDIHAVSSVFISTMEVSKTHPFSVDLSSLKEMGKYLSSINETVSYFRELVFDEGLSFVLKQQNDQHNFRAIGEWFDIVSNGANELFDVASGSISATVFTPNTQVGKGETYYTFSDVTINTQATNAHALAYDFYGEIQNLIDSAERGVW